MKNYRMFNSVVNFDLILDTEIEIEELQKHLGKYVSFESAEPSELSDLKIVITSNFNQLNQTNTPPINLDGYWCILKSKTLYVIMNDNSKEEKILFTKRLLSDLTNRFIELKGGLFLHSSSIIDKDQSIVFIGDKGSGKTTNMLYMLSQGGLAYSSNERTALFKKGNLIYTYGNPSRINIRANTLEKNKNLCESLWNKINQENYEKYKNLNLPNNCSERLVISFEDLKECLNIQNIPFSKLGTVCNLIYDSSIKFHMEQVSYESIKSDINKSVIDGVFEQRKELNQIFQGKPTNVDDILLSGNYINYFNIYHDCSTDNSQKIMKTIQNEKSKKICLK